MALSANTPVKQCIGECEEYPVAASSNIYMGSMVGSSSGYARALVAGDQFLGHAKAPADNSAGANGAIRVEVFSGIYWLECTLASVAITDLGKDVYASDDGTLTLTPGSNSFVGKVKRYVGTNTCVVEFHPNGGGDVQNHEHTAVTDGGVLTSPRVVTGINDTSGNELLKVTATASAVNELTLANAATGNGPSVTATGGDTDIDITIDPKGAGGLNLGSADSELGFFGTAAVVQQAHIADASESHTITGSDQVSASGVKSALDALGVKVNAALARLEAYGLSKTS